MGQGGVDRDYIKTLILDIKTAVEEVLALVSKPYESLSKAEKYAIRYSLIIIAETVSALALHIARRALRAVPQTPIHALRLLRDSGFLSPRECDELERLVKLRNLLAHRYWVVDDRRVYESVKGDFESLLNFLQRLEMLYGI
ncbi:DUF86 domain-containing protein [Pyrobaculum aerophilum]|nr:DUF86 domain-containing protein [Pyrobaculum aerophilum]